MYVYLPSKNYNLRVGPSLSWSGRVRSSSQPLVYLLHWAEVASINWSALLRTNNQFCCETVHLVTNQRLGTSSAVVHQGGKELTVGCHLYL
jgi:hypothetical protein